MYLGAGLPAAAVADVGGLRLRLADGREIRATGDHKFLTAEMARDFGIVDKVIDKRSEEPTAKTP